MGKFRDFFFDEDDVNVADGYYNQPATTTPTPAPQPQHNSKVVKFDVNREASGNIDSHIELVEPRLYGDAREIATQLLSGTAVIVNFGQMDPNVAMKVIDFLNGTVFAIDGEIKRIGEQIFLCAPKNFAVDGKLAVTLDKLNPDEL